MNVRNLSLILLAGVVLAACGKPDAPAAAGASAPDTASTTAAAPASAPTEVATAAADNALGKSTFGKVCAMCHAAGVGGAPKPGDKADWGPRIAQGKDTLYQHALEGFTGSKGMMPARGGSPALKDEEVKAGVDYMADQSR